MAKPVTYYRLTKNRHFVGFSRIVIEYLSADGVEWQLNPVENDEDEKIKLSTPPLGIEGLKRKQMEKSSRERDKKKE